MMTFIYILLTIVGILVLLFLINKFIPRKAYPIVSILLWVVIGVLGYMLFNSIYDPIKFEEVKEERYALAIDKLQDIRAAQVAHRDVTGTFAKDYNALIRFVDTASFVITSQRDTTYADVERNKRYGLDAETGGYFLQDVIIDTIGYEGVKDRLFKGSNDYKDMMNITLKDGTVKKIEMKTGEILKKDRKLPVFKAFIRKDVLLAGEDKNYINQENERQSVEDVNGPEISVGSLEDVSTAGNWPKTYGDVE